MVNIIKEELSLEKAFQKAIVSLKLYEIPEDQTPQLYVSDGIEAKNIYSLAFTYAFVFPAKIPLSMLASLLYFWLGRVNF